MAGEKIECLSPLAKGIIGTFDVILKQLCQVAYLSGLNDYEVLKLPNLVKPSHIFFLKINEDSTDEDLCNFFNSLEIMPIDDFVYKNDTNVNDFCSSFKTLRDLVERKLCMKSQTWLEIKEKERRFPEDDRALFNELRELQEKVEKLKLQKNQQISKKVAAKEKVLNSLSVADDFKSQHPFFLKANAREQIEFIETINERKVALLRKDQEKAQKNYQDATLKHRAEMWRVIEETMRTKTFINWLKEKNKAVLKNLKDEFEELWGKFCDEMQNSKELCLKYRDINEIYMKVLADKRQRELEAKRLAAAKVLTFHFRKYLDRKKGIIRIE